VYCLFLKQWIMFLQVKEKRTELEKLKTMFVRRASEFLRNYFASLVDFMISDKSYFSQVFSAFCYFHTDYKDKYRVLEF